MAEKWEQIAPLFEAVRQAVLILEQDRVVYRNPEAVQRLRSLSDQQALTLQEGPATLQGSAWQVHIRQWETCRVMTLEQTDAAPALCTQLLDVIAQSLRQPLGNAMAVAQTLFPRLLEWEDPKVAQQMAVMDQSFYQMLRLVSNLSDVSDYLSGQIELRRRAVDVVAWFSSLEEKLTDYCADKQVTLRRERPEKSCIIYADITQVERALVHLVSNALKFTPAGGQITLRLEVGATQIRLQVLDDGEGIDPAVLETLYWRAVSREALGDPRWGVGLGMQLVRQVAMAHGGAVVAQRRAEGGTCVTISLERTAPPDILSSPTLGFSYNSGFDPILLGLSDVLPASSFSGLWKKQSR